MTRLVSLALLSAVALLAACGTTEQMAQGKPEYMVIGIDNKVTWGDDGKVQLLPPGKDAVTIVDIGSEPANPKIVASLPLMNSIFGRRLNLGITPKPACACGQFNGLGETATTGKPTRTTSYTSSTSRPARRPASTQSPWASNPQACRSNRAGNLALIANRADNSISGFRSLASRSLWSIPS
jgi:hypothetical protein